jgi:hypothetical protein
MYQQGNKQHCEDTELTHPTRYGLTASPSACAISIWIASAVDRRVGATLYCNTNSKFLAAIVFSTFIALHQTVLRPTQLTCQGMAITTHHNLVWRLKTE